MKKNNEQNINRYHWLSSSNSSLAILCLLSLAFFYFSYYTHQKVHGPLFLYKKDYTLSATGKLRERARKVVFMSFLFLSFICFVLCCWWCLLFSLVVVVYWFVATVSPPPSANAYLFAFCSPSHQPQSDSKQLTGDAQFSSSDSCCFVINYNFSQSHGYSLAFFVCHSLHTERERMRDNRLLI